MTGVGTVATAVLLLDSDTVAPPDGAAAVKLTVPSPRLPAATLVALSVTPDTAADVPVGLVDEPEPQSDTETAAAIVKANVMNGE